MGPGGLHDSSKYWNCTGGAAAWIDRKFFGYNHIYDGPTSFAVYQVDQYIDGDEGNHHDPEGLLGSINSIVIVFFGLQAGKILLHFTDFKNRMIRFGAWGCKFMFICCYAKKRKFLSVTDCNCRWPLCFRAIRRTDSYQQKSVDAFVCMSYGWLGIPSSWRSLHYY